MEEAKATCRFRGRERLEDGRPPLALLGSKGKSSESGGTLGTVAVAPCGRKVERKK